MKPAVLALCFLFAACDSPERRAFEDELARSTVVRVCSTGHVIRQLPSGHFVIYMAGWQYAAGPGVCP